MRAEFYGYFKGNVNAVLLNLFNETYNLKALQPIFLRTHTVLLPKFEIVTKIQQVSGSGPITLCNADNILFTFA